MKEQEWSQHFSHCKSMGIFPDAQGQLTPQSIVRPSRISNSIHMLWLSLLPEKIMKIQSKMKALECSQHYISFSDAQGQINLESMVSGPNLKSLKLS